MEKFLLRYRVPVVVGTLVFFGVLYGMLSFGNHLMFRTYGLDLGIYTQALYDYAHLQGNDCSFFLWEPSNLLADHFDLYLVLLSPLVYLFGEYTLLVVQLLAVLLGLWGMYRLTRLYTDSEWLQVLAMLLLGTAFGVWHAFGFDYHSNVVSALLLPWLLYYVKRKHAWGVVLLAVAMSIAKETSALWVAFVLLALLWDWRGDRRMRRLLAWTTVGCLAYFMIVGLLVMPSLDEGGSKGFWRYSWMGSNMGEMATWVLMHPLEAVHDLFIDFTPDADNGQLKTEFFICALLSGGLLTLCKPNYLLMLVPPVAMKMLAKDTGFWGVTYHYNVEICVVLAVASSLVLSQSFRGRLQHIVAWGAVALTIGTLVYTTDNPKTYIRKENVRVFDARHWRQPDFDRSTVHQLMQQIPDEASVCATTMFTPYLAARDSVYIFPMGLAYGADYYLLLKHHWCYYEGEEEQVDKMINDTVRYRVVDHDDNVYLLVAKDFVER